MSSYLIDSESNVNKIHFLRREKVMLDVVLFFGQRISADGNWYSAIEDVVKVLTDTEVELSQVFIVPIGTTGG